MSRTGIPSAKLAGSPSTSAGVSRSPPDSSACCSLPPAQPYRLDDATVARIIRVHQDQADDLTLFQNQADRWNVEPGLTSAQRAAVQEYEAGELALLIAVTAIAARAGTLVRSRRAQLAALCDRGGRWSGNGCRQTLILDEPASGLDPAGVHWLRGLLRGLAAEGRTVFVSSHLLAELAQSADDVVLINHGRLVTAGPVASLLGRAGAASLEGFFLDATSPDAPPAHPAPARARSLS